MLVHTTEIHIQVCIPPLGYFSYAPLHPATDVNRHSTIRGKAEGDET